MQLNEAARTARQYVRVRGQCNERADGARMTGDDVEADVERCTQYVDITKTACECTSTRIDEQRHTRTQNVNTSRAETIIPIAR